MSTATTNTRDLNPTDKAARGVTIIQLGTANPLVPGNGPCLAIFSAAQTALVAANTAVAVAREALKQAVIVRNNAVIDWDAKVVCLCAFTESATAGSAQAIVSAGFGVRAEPAPTQPLAAPVNLLVRTNGSPGASRLTWALEGADSFVIECSPDPITEDSFEQVLVTTKSRCEIAGAEPGKLCWFRVAGVNALGQGPWSAVAPRPVM